MLVGVVALFLCFYLRLSFVGTTCASFGSISTNTFPRTSSRYLLLSEAPSSYSRMQAKLSSCSRKGSWSRTSWNCSSPSGVSGDRKNNTDHNKDCIAAHGYIGHNPPVQCAWNQGTGGAERSRCAAPTDKTRTQFRCRHDRADRGRHP